MPDPDNALDPAELDALWDFADPAASEMRIRAAFVARAGTPAAAELTTQIARALALLGRYDDARALLDGLTSPHEPLLRTRIALERGRLARASGDHTGALPFFHDAAEAARAAGDDFLLVDALHMLAIADADRALDWTRQALTVVNGTSDVRTRRWAGSLRNNLGWTLHEQGDHTGALHQFEAALEAYQATGTAEQVHTARWAIARALRSLGRCGEALDIQHGLTASGAPDGFVQEELAELLLMEGDTSAAATHFAAAADLLAEDASFARSEPERLARLRELGQSLR